MKQRRLVAAAAAVVGLSLVAAACGDDSDEETTASTQPSASETNSTTAPSGSGGLSGTVVVSGSSTVEPISIRVSEKFRQDNPDVDVSVDGPGTGDGFELFCNGETDINDASSKVKPEQEQACAENGIEFIELQIGNDGISVMTNTANDAVECLSFADLYALIGPESQGFDNWSDAQALAAELGSTTQFPDAPLDIVGPGEESGTFSSFVELVIENFNEDRGQDATTRPDYQSSADDNVIIQGIEGSDTSLGWVGFAYAKEAANVKILPIAEEPGGECIEPTDETIADSSYPISRPLFIYVNKAKAETNPALAAYVDFYLSDAGIASVSEVGYVELSPADLEATRAVWEAREVGPQ
ncbi:MAG TPA: phosphate ABC transporter substrate-binding protein PstS family protein [Acidimicrobiales bacterium]